VRLLMWSVVVAQCARLPLLPAAFRRRELHNTAQNWCMHALAKRLYAKVQLMLQQLATLSLFPLKLVKLLMVLVVLLAAAAAAATTLQLQRHAVCILLYVCCCMYVACAVRII
jgi:hypothetical protein